MASLAKYVPETFTPVLLHLKHEPGQMTPRHSHLIKCLLAWEAETQDPGRALAGLPF